MERVKEEPHIEAEKREKEPKIFYHFFYSPHQTAKDIENLEKAFKEADIYIPEVVFWPSFTPDIFQGISDGQITPEKAVDISEEKSSRLRELEIIYNSKKPILLADVSAADIELIKKYEAVIQLAQEVIDFFKQGDFKKSLQRTRSLIEKDAQFHLEREAKIKENLKSQIIKFLDNNPKYKQKEKIKILVRLGSFHTKIYQDFKKENLPISREFNKLPIVYLSFNEAKRRIMFGKEIDDELLARGIIEEVIYPSIKDLTDDSDKLFWLIRNLSSQLTFKDIKQIAKDFGENPALDITEELEKFNIKVPKSEEEIDKILGTTSSYQAI